MSPDGLEDIKDILANTATPFGLQLAPHKCELICFHRLGTIDKSQLPVIKLGDTIVPWKTSVVCLGLCRRMPVSNIGET